MSDQPVEETSAYTGQHNKHPCPERDSNPRPQTYALDRAATGIGKQRVHNVLKELLCHMPTAEMM
jgi:hypothetical protein